MSEQKQAASMDEAEAQARLRSFEVGVGKLCNELGVEYDAFAKAANAALPQLGIEKFAAADEDASGLIAPWLVSVFAEQAAAADAAK